MEPKRRKFNKLCFPHCEQEVSKSTWYVHRSQFYDEVRKTWRRKDPSLTATHDQDFDCGSSDEVEDIDERCELPMDIPATTDEVMWRCISLVFLKDLVLSAIIIYV